MMQEFPSFLFPLLADDCRDVVPFIAIRCYLFRNGCLPDFLKRLLLLLEKAFIRIVFLTAFYRNVQCLEHVVKLPEERR